ncbi:MAG: hypothetical protein AAF731_16010 [Bacteroidota bacterium]
MSKVFENQFVTCELDEAIPVLTHTWHCEPPEGEFKKNLLQVLDHYNQLKISYKNLKWLADTQLLRELSEEDEEWLVTEWDHLLFEEAGLKVHAVILGEDFYADYPMEKFKQSSAKKFNDFGATLEVFLNKENAINWLIKER